jgi:hypothetical protein
MLSGSPIEEVRRWCERNADRAEFARFWDGWAALQIFGERPATELALELLADDLERLGFACMRASL